MTRVLHRTSGRLGVALMVLIAVAAIVGPALAQDPNLADYTNQLQAPSRAHWLGTDLAGRDLLARTLGATRLSMQTVALVFVATTVLGLVVGGIAGFARGIIDSVLSRVIDVLLGLPSLIVALALVGVLGVGSRSLIIALVSTGWAGTARLTRGLVLDSHFRLDVVTARMAGIGPVRNLFTHVLPAILYTVLTAATAGIVDTVLALAGLSFLGLGAQPPTAELGQMMAESQTTLGVAPWQLIGPGTVLVLTVSAASLVNNALSSVGVVPGNPARGRWRRASKLIQPARLRSNATLPVRSDPTPQANALVINDLKVTYLGGVNAVRGVSLSLGLHECLALVGESGCGKTSVARATLGLLPADACVEGTIRVGDDQIVGMSEASVRRIRGRQVGYVPQDPFAACDPLRAVRHHVEEPWRNHGVQVPADFAAAELNALGVPDSSARIVERPHQWSGGMLQRATLAAAGAHRPPVMVADEPTSALDTEHARGALERLRMSSRSLLLVSHDLDMVARESDRVAVMYAGRIVETGPTAEVINDPRHPYTQALLAATPRAGGSIPIALAGSPPSLVHGRSCGCPFAARCPVVVPRCHDDEPRLDDGVACWLSAS